MTAPLDVGVPRELQERRVPRRDHARRRARAHGARRHRARRGRAPAPARRSPTTSTAARARSWCADAADVWARADLVLKVKEPQPEEFAHLRPGLVLFTYLHLAAYPEVADALLEHEVVGVAYETVQLESGALPLLAPMSEVAGRMAPQVGSHFLERANGGRGVLLGGAPGVRPARVVVIGAGNVGWNAAWIAQGMEAEVLLFDRNLDRLRWVDQIHKGRIMTLASNRLAVDRAVAGSRPRHRRGARARRARAGRRHRRDGALDASGIGHRRLRDRPGRLGRGHPRDVARRSRLRAPRRAALRRGQHSRRGAAHLDVRVDQRDAALRARARDAWRRRGACATTPSSRRA